MLVIPDESCKIHISESPIQKSQNVSDNNNIPYETNLKTSVCLFIISIVLFIFIVVAIQKIIV